MRQPVSVRLHASVWYLSSSHAGHVCGSRRQELKEDQPARSAEQRSSILAIYPLIYLRARLHTVAAFLSNLSTRRQFRIFGSSPSALQLAFLRY